MLCVLMCQTPFLMKRSYFICIAISLLLVYDVTCSSCSSYRVATHAQGATYNTPANSKRAYSLFWGLLNNPQVITTPVCDSLGVYGVSEVIVKKNVGDALLTVFTLGIY